MKKYFFILACLASLAACGTPSIYSSGPRSVVVSSFLKDESQVQAVADAECKKYGRYAQLAGVMTGHKLTFDCVQ
jgi:hypothetical protein